MKFVAIRELRNDTSKVLRNLKKEGVVITRHGKPAAALVYLDEDLLEEFVLARDKKLRTGLKKAKKEFLEKGGISYDQMRKEIERRRVK
jgi:prevent-host-death family protein